MASADRALEIIKACKLSIHDKVNAPSGQMLARQIFYLFY